MLRGPPIALTAESIKQKKNERLEKSFLNSTFTSRITEARNLERRQTQDLPVPGETRGRYELAIASRKKEVMRRQIQCVDEIHENEKKLLREALSRLAPDMKTWDNRCYEPTSFDMASLKKAKEVEVKEKRK